MHWLLFYDYVPDYLERRGDLRADHVEYLRPYLERGQLLLGGAFANPADGAALLFEAEAPDVVEGFAEEDPYVLGGLVTGWRVREWTTVVGEGAASPIRRFD